MSRDEYDELRDESIRQRGRFDVNFGWYVRALADARRPQRMREFRQRALDEAAKQEGLMRGAHFRLRELEEDLYFIARRGIAASRAA